MGARLICDPLLPIAALALLFASAAAEAKPVLYKCEDGSQLAVDFTPRLAQVKTADMHWTLARVRDSSTAHFVNSGAGVTLVSLKREATLTVGKRELRCKFEVMRPTD